MQTLNELFAPPTPAELQAVRDDWASRPNVVDGYQFEAMGTDSQGVAFHVISHLVDGERHYGAVRFPRNYTPGGQYPALVVCHGGLVGVSAEESANFLHALPGQCVDDEFFLIIPSYRSEPLITGFAGTFQSEGTPSYADGDIDDARMLLSSVLLNYPDVDHARIGAWGISRGGAVALILAERDDRVRLVVDLFGFTDFALPTVRDRLDQIINQGATPMGIGRVAWESFCEAYINGTMSLADARLAWLRRSACYFATDLPRVQAHHGLQDFQVDASHTQVLLGALAAAGLGPPDVEGFFYPNGLHGLNSLVGHGDYVEPFLCSLNLGPRGYCGPMAPHHLGLYAAADYRGSCSVAENDFEMRANFCRPSSFGIVFVSPEVNYQPSGAGYLCLGPGTRRLGTGVIDAAGTMRLPIDIANPAIEVAPYFAVGETVNLQVVFRDVGNPNGNWNWSNGLSITIEP